MFLWAMAILIDQPHAFLPESYQSSSVFLVLRGGTFSTQPLTVPSTVTRSHLSTFVRPSSQKESLKHWPASFIRRFFAILMAIFRCIILVFSKNTSILNHEKWRPPKQTLWRFVFKLWRRTWPPLFDHQAAAAKTVGIVGPATVGGMMPGRFRIGNAGGAVETLGLRRRWFWGAKVKNNGLRCCLIRLPYNRFYSTDF